MKRIGPRIDPCGIRNKSKSLILAIDSHNLSPISAVRLKPRKNGARNARKRLKSVGEHMVVDVSKAKNRPGMIKTDTSPPSRASRMSVVILRGAVSVL